MTNPHIKTIIAQAKQWPPTGTTIFGICLIVGAIDYVFRGNIAEAASIAGVMSYILPEDKGYVEKAEEVMTILSKLDESSKVPK